MGTYLFFSLLYHLHDSDSTQRRYSWKSIFLLSTLNLMPSYCSHAEFSWRIRRQPGGQGAPLNRPHLLSPLISTSVSKHSHFLWPPVLPLTERANGNNCHYKSVIMASSAQFPFFEIGILIKTISRVPFRHPSLDKLGLKRIKTFSVPN